MATQTTRPRHTCNPDRPGQPRPFGRPAPAGECEGCDERAVERAAGIPARTNGYVEAVQRAARLDEQRAREIRDHDCARAGCGRVCTFGDW